MLEIPDPTIGKWTAPGNHDPGSSRLKLASDPRNAFDETR